MNNITLDESEAALSRHALEFYMNAKGEEVSENTRRLEEKLRVLVDRDEPEQQSVIYACVFELATICSVEWFEYLKMAEGFQCPGTKFQRFHALMSSLERVLKLASC